MMYGLVQLGGCIFRAAFWRIYWEPEATWSTVFFRLRECGEVIVA